MYQFSIPSPNDINSVSDWVELYILSNETFLSKSELQSQIETSFGKEPSDDFIDAVWNELERRKLLYGNNTPFKIERRYIENKISIKNNPVYAFCLLLSLFGNDKNSLNVGKLFERVANTSIKNYFNAETIIYGFPQKQSFEEIVKIVDEKYQFCPPQRFQDRGVDIVAWKPFGDKRTSKAIFLIQCAAGHNWRTKTTELPIGAWKQYACWGEYLLKGFCLPQIISEVEFEEVSYEAGILIDRGRIIRFLEENISEELKEKVLEKINEKIQENLV